MENKDSITVNGETYYIGEACELSCATENNYRVHILSPYDCKQIFEHSLDIRPIQQKELSAEELYRACVGKYELTGYMSNFQIIGVPHAYQKELIHIGGYFFSLYKIDGFRPIGSQDEWRPISELPREGG